MTRSSKPGRLLPVLVTVLGHWSGAAVMSLVHGSFWAALILLWLGQTGPWRYFDSTLRAHEFSLAAREINPSRPMQMPLVIAVDEAGYQGFFAASMPLPRQQLLALMRVVQEHTPANARIALDLPVGPVSTHDAAQAELDAFWLQQPARWVLPAWPEDPVNSPGVEQVWREKLCRQGVSFGLPGVPIEFGYPRLSHQYVGSLADVLMREQPACSGPDRVPAQQAQPLLPAALAAGAVIPFQGDLDALAQILDTLAPEKVLIGRAWGPQRLVGTPLGERYEIQVHAAAAAGVLSGERWATPAFRLMAVWALVSGLWLLMTYLLPVLEHLLTPLTPTMYGHAFLWMRCKLLLIILVLLLCLNVGVWLGSAWHAATGYWLSADLGCSVSLLLMSFSWNLGRHPLVRHANAVVAWREGLWRPLCSAWQEARRKGDDAAPRHWGRPLAICSLCWQLMLPLVGALGLVWAWQLGRI